MDLKKLSKEQKLKLLAAFEEQERRYKENLLSRTFPEDGDFARKHYPKQMEFFAAGAKYKERAFIAGNRTGKSFAGAYELTLHLTGMYPDWWTGRRFAGPINAWAAGKTNETTRDIIQEKLLGKKGEYGTGMIPKDVLGRITTRPGVPDAVQDIYVAHVTGGVSRVSLKSYQQGTDSFEGTEIHVIWLDEEPEKESTYSECLTRTMTVKGIIFCTFTPLKGISNVVLSFQPGGIMPPNGIASESKYVVAATWSDVPEAQLSAEEKKIMLAAYSPHERDARSKGIAALGAGRIYPIPEEDLLVDPFKIPSEWPCAYGMDVGWAKTAVIWGAIDPNTHTLYLYDEYYRGEVEPAIHMTAIKARGDWLYGAIDYAQANNNTGEGIRNQYLRLGLKVVPANKTVEPGLLAVYRMMSEGKLKVFRTCQNWTKEFRIYRRREEDGQVVKQNDHLMDATRYLVMTGINCASPKPDLDDLEFYTPPTSSKRDANDITGY